MYWIFLLIIGLFRFLLFSLFTFYWFCVSSNSSVSSRVSCLLVYSYLKSSYSFYFRRISSNVTIFSSHVNNLDLSFLVHLVKALSAFFFFLIWRTTFWYYRFFCNVLLFSVSFIFALTCTTTSVCWLWVWCLLFVGLFFNVSLYSYKFLS